jgi:cytidylate kinase
MRQPVITISRQRGSGADEVAALVSEKLGIPLYDQQVISHAAAEAGVSESAMHDAERSQGFLSRMLESLGRYAGMGVEGSVPIDFSSVSMLYTSADFRAVIEQVLRNIADSGPGVIVGHGGAQVALRRRADVLHVFIHAPMEQRIRRMMVWRGLSREEARRDVEETDKGRTDFFKVNYDVNWYDLRLYDLVVNTGGRTYEDVAEEICSVARLMEERSVHETPDAPPHRA